VLSAMWCSLLKWRNSFPRIGSSLKYAIRVSDIFHLFLKFSKPILCVLVYMDWISE
jgi:hypothetical protein